MRRTRRLSGLSLIEILVTLAIFVIGILAVLRIFPKGLSIVTTTAERNEAVRLGEARMNDLRQRESALPELILAAGLPTGTDPLNLATFGYLRLDDGSDAYRPYDLDVTYGNTGDEAGLLHRLAARDRLIVGERALVSLGIDTSGSTVVSGPMPYLTLFGPIEADAGAPKLAIFREFKRVDPLELRRTVVTGASGQVYRDRPYFAVVDGGVDDFTGTPAADKLLLELDSEPRLFSVKLSYVDDTGAVRWAQLAPLTVPGTAVGGGADNLYSVDLQLPGAGNPKVTRVIAASVSVRQVLYPSPNPGARFDCDASGFAHGVLRLPPALAGETLSLEYVVDDWRNLTETLSVDVAGGQITANTLQVAARNLLQGFTPILVVVSTGQRLDVDQATWDGDAGLARSGQIPIDPAAANNQIGAPDGSQDVIVYYRREGDWAVAPTIAPRDYVLSSDVPASYPVLPALVDVVRNGYTSGPDVYTDLYFRPSEAGRTVAVSYEVNGANGRELVSGELHVVPPQPNRQVVIAGQPESRHAIRLDRPNVADDGAATPRLQIHAVEGRSLQMRVTYDDQAISRPAEPCITVGPSPTGSWECAQRLIELNWYVRR
ncbi:MAG: hypothetical protein HYU66_25865 [Armatimonadetes bacterium]|nr:hypothetical protein [Armatimonadota bacterium]